MAILPIPIEQSTTLSAILAKYMACLHISITQSCNLKDSEGFTTRIPSFVFETSYAFHR